MDILLHILWLVPAFTLTTQDLVELSVNPNISAGCGKQVILNCKVSSQLNGLSIKYMEWSHNKMSLCFVNSAGYMNSTKCRLNKCHCEYTKGNLSLIFEKMQPLDIGNYGCKIRSNRGFDYRNTIVALQECSGSGKGVFTSSGPACTFNNVYPDGDVNWFNGSHSLSDGSMKHQTTKRVEAGGWLSIHSILEHKRSDVHYNCSLKSIGSGRYIESILVQSQQNGITSQGPMGTVLGISILLAVTLK